MMSFFKFNEPRVGISDGLAWRRAGLLYRKSFLLAAAEQVVALKRDGLTSEQVFVAFVAGGKTGFWVSEFDHGFGEFLRELPCRFPGIRDLAEMNHGEAFEQVDFVLWQTAPAASAVASA